MILLNPVLTSQTAGRISDRGAFEQLTVKPRESKNLGTSGPLTEEPPMQAF